MIAIILVTYNGEHDLPLFFQTLLPTLPREGVLLYIVDNASSDSTRMIIERDVPDAVHIFSETNDGYSGGHVRGMTEALKRGVEYIILVNQDMEFVSGWIEPLVDYMNAHPRCGVVQPMIALAQDKGLLNSCGNALHYLGFGYSMGYTQPVATCTESSMIGYTSGATVMYRASALREVGLFDPEFFMYHEDTDLAWRFRLAGWGCAVTPTSTVYHRYEFGRSEKKFYYIERNRIAILLRNYSFKTLLLIAPAFFFMEAGLLVRALLSTVMRLRITPVLHYCASRLFWFSPRRFAHILLERRKIQNVRVISDTEIVPYFVSSIDAQEVDSGIMRMVVNPVLRWYWNIIRRWI